MKNNAEEYDVIIIGGGFYGSMIALEMRKLYKKVVVVEKEKQLLMKASYNNQARVHNGYHYPRNFITALRSHKNYDRFVTEFSEAVQTENEMIYAISQGNSKSTAKQFIHVCNQIGSPLKKVPQNLRKYFNELLIEDMFMVEEVVFDAAKLRQLLAQRLETNDITILYQGEIIKVQKQANSTIKVFFTETEYLNAKVVINCTYSDINTILHSSDLPALPMKYEYAEMPIVTMPEPLQNVGITIMDGPFFSIMPFPDKRMHSFHHVRYTPHLSWTGDSGRIMNRPKTSNYIYMRNDAQRYIPILKELRYKESLYEIKTILMQNEENDGRPILFRKDYGIKNFHIVMGGKLDNIYDIYKKMEISAISN